MPCVRFLARLISDRHDMRIYMNPMRWCAIAVTTAAIIPLVPGVAIFRGLLGIVQAEGAFDGLVIGGNALVIAAITAVALAAGVSFGLYMATPVRSTLRRVSQARVGLHH